MIPIQMGLWFVFFRQPFGVSVFHEAAFEPTMVLPGSEEAELICQ